MLMAQPALAGFERRIAPRFDLMAQVRVKRGSVDYLMDLTNISMSGALVDMGTLRIPGWVKKGRVVEIGIIHPIDLDAITVLGEIVRVDKGAKSSFAVQFVDVDADTRDGLERLHRAAIEPVAEEPKVVSVPPPARKRPPPLPKGPPPLPKGPPPLPKGPPPLPKARSSRTRS